MANKKMKRMLTMPTRNKGICTKTTSCAEIGERQSFAFAFISKFKI
jgi:hypothetical protein